MITVVLGIIGFVLLALSGYLLYRNSSNSISAEKQKQLDEAIKQIEVLNAEIVEKDKIVDEAEQSGKKKIVMESRTASSKDSKNVLLLKKIISYLTSMHLGFCALYICIIINN